MPLTVDEAAFKEIMQPGKPPVVLEFWAEWCGPCQVLDPILYRLEKEFGERVRIGKVNVDEETTLASLFNIRSIPTILFFRDGQQVDQVVGLITERGLRRLIGKLEEG
jgi:thioredoxin